MNLNTARRILNENGYVMDLDESFGSRLAGIALASLIGLGLGFGARTGIDQLSSFDNAVNKTLKTYDSMDNFEKLNGAGDKISKGIYAAVIRYAQEHNTDTFQAAGNMINKLKHGTGEKFKSTLGDEYESSLGASEIRMVKKIMVDGMPAIKIVFSDDGDTGDVIIPFDPSTEIRDGIGHVSAYNWGHR